MNKTLVVRLLRPSHAIRLADLIVYLQAFKAHRPELAEQAKQAIRQGRYYEQN